MLKYTAFQTRTPEFWKSSTPSEGKRRSSDPGSCSTRAIPAAHRREALCPAGRVRQVNVISVGTADRQSSSSIR